jgi:rhodanese-related sulfurtransferase
VRNIGAADVAAMIKDGWTVLDVRPPTETSKAAIKDAVVVSAVLIS